MTEERLALSELLEKAGDGDFLRSVAEAVLQLLMEADVEGLMRLRPAPVSAAQQWPSLPVYFRPLHPVERSPSAPTRSPHKRSPSMPSANCTAALRDTVPPGYYHRNLAVLGFHLIKQCRLLGRAPLPATRDDLSL
jgi:hypothetical protein